MVSCYRFNDDSVKIAGVWVTIVTSDFNRYGFLKKLVCLYFELRKVNCPVERSAPPALFVAL